ncbi:MAG: hypothetical protein O2999_09280 [Nitrospirae bacterium]|nr:hypothetical protein [Nitrospirota bacterium]
MSATRIACSDLDSLNWTSLHHSLLTRGYAHVPGLVKPSACRALSNLYDQDRYFRSRIDIALGFWLGCLFLFC